MSREFNKAIGKLIRAKRRALDFSQIQLEDMLIMKRGQLTRIENGTGGLQIETAFLLCNALDIEITEIFNLFRELHPTGGVGIHFLKYYGAPAEKVHVGHGTYVGNE